MTIVHVLFITFIILMGFCKGEWKNLTKPGDPKHHPSGFFPHGASGVFNGAAMVYLSYIGYDAVSTMAEEVKNPVKDIPIGVSGSVVIVTALYCLMSASMCMLLPYDMVRTNLIILIISTIFNYITLCKRIKHFFFYFETINYCFPPAD